MHVTKKTTDQKEQVVVNKPEEVTADTLAAERKDLIGTSDIIFTGLYSKEVEVVPGYKVTFRSLGNKANARVANLINLPEGAKVSEYIEAAIVPTLAYAINEIVVEKDGTVIKNVYHSADEQEEESLRQDLYQRLCKDVPQLFLNLLFDKYLLVVTELRDAMNAGLKKKP